MSENRAPSPQEENLDTILSRLVSSLHDLLPGMRTAQISTARIIGDVDSVTVTMSWTALTTLSSTSSKRSTILIEDKKVVTTISLPSSGGQSS